MERLKKAKLAINAIRCCAFKITPKSSIQPPTSTINQFSPSSCKSSLFYPSSSSSIFNRFSLPSKITPKTSIQPPTSTINQFSPSSCKSSLFYPSSSSIIFNRFSLPSKIGKRYYCVDRNQIHHCKPRGPNRWFQDPRTVIAVVFVGSGVFITVCFGHLENVPYTKRKHFVLLSKSMERKLGENRFEARKKEFKGKILPAIHPESVRVRLVAKEIIEALQRGLKKENVWTDMSYASADSGFGNADETLKALMGDNEDIKWNKEDEILDDKLIQQTRKKAQEKGSRAQTSHLDGLNWEVLVVNEPVVDAFCLPGGKIVVFTGLLDHFKTDAEVATIIAHEVGHVVARHSAELITTTLWFGFLLYQFAISATVRMTIATGIASFMSIVFLRLPFSRRMEIEADSIGLLLMASAGYDPRVAPPVLEMLGKVEGDSELDDYLSTHPSGQTRAKVLAEAKVMEEALAIYRGALSKRD